MKIQQALKHFGTQVSLASSLNVTQPCVSGWVKRGKIPHLQQLRLEALTGGKLKADGSILPRVSRS